MNSSQSPRLFTVTAVVCILASAVTLWSQHRRFDVLDLWLLPSISFCWLAAALAVQFRWARLSQAQLLIFSAYAVYFLLALHHQFRVFAPHYHMLSQNTYWFAPLYAAAFLYLLPGQAMRYSLTIFSLSLVIIASHFLSNRALMADTPLVASTLQFILAGAVMILLQVVMGRRHMAMLATQMAAYQDALTGSANRRAAEEHMLALQRQQLPFTLALLDLDHFKRINDQYGHAVGDAVLRAVTYEAQRVLPPGSMCARWGGEEFLLILPDRSITETHTFLEQLRKVLTQLQVGEVTGVTASFGVARRIPPEHPDEALSRADVALYEAKAQGRNRIQYSDAVNQRLTASP